MQQQDSIIRLRNVGLNYGASQSIFHDIHLSLPAGSFHFLTGPSGAGKSSLIKLMYLGLRSYTGMIEIMGQDISTINADEAATMRQRIGVVFQDFRLLDHLSVIDNVALPLRIRGMTQRKSRHVAQDILNWVDLGDRADAYPQILSGGEKQRVALARAVIGKPKVLLADEPTGSVDDAIAVKLLHLFEELHRLGTTIVFATHNHDLTHLFPHPILHLQDGGIQMITPTQDKKVASYA